MSHIRSILESVASHDKKQKVLRQYTQAMPKLFHGYIPSESVDVAYELQGHTPLLRDLRGPYNKKAKEPADAWVLSVNTLMDSSDNAVLQPVSGKICKDLRKIGCMSAMHNDVTKATDGQGESYRSFVGIPCMRPTGDTQAPVFKPEHESLSRAVSYMMVAQVPGKDGGMRAIATPAEVAEVFGYTGLMDALKPEHAERLQSKLGLDLGKAMRVALANDADTGAKLIVYMMAHKRITPAEVEKDYGHDMLIQACSHSNVKWLRGLRGLPEGTLADELPLAERYLRQRSMSQSQVMPRREDETGSLLVTTPPSRSV